MLQYQTFSAATKMGRLIAGFTQTELAELTGISKSQISRIERGQLIPEANTITQIARSLQIDRRYLLISAAFTTLSKPTRRDKYILTGILAAIKTPE